MNPLDTFHKKDKEIVLADETGTDNPAFEIGKTLCHQRRPHALGGRSTPARNWGQP
jgi:hypothetical protein